MDHLFPAMHEWHKILFPEPSWGEKLLRPILVYAFLLGAFRLLGKRELAQVSLFDLLVLLLISNVVQNALIGEDNSVFGACAGAISVFAVSYTLNRISARSKKAQDVIEGKPTLLVYDGKELTEAMQREQVDHDDLLTSLRRQGIASLAEVRYAVLELDGSISVIKADAPKPDTRDDCVTADILEQARQECLLASDTRPSDADDTKKSNKRGDDDTPRAGKPSATSPGGGGASS